MATATKTPKKAGKKKASKSTGKTTKAKGTGTPRATERPKGSEGIVRRAILRALGTRDMNRNEVKLRSGVPGTTVFEYLRDDTDGRQSISLKNAEAILVTLGLTEDALAKCLAA